MEPMPEEPLQQPANGFKQYPSIESKLRGRFEKMINKAGHTAPDVEWVACEKIHGCNFSIHWRDGHILYGRRNDFITKPIPIPCNKFDDYFLENFYEAKTLVGRFHNKLNQVIEKVKLVDKDACGFSIYGEYFGGNWIDPDVPTAKCIQKGVYYCPGHEFMAFDLLIINPTSGTWAPVTDLERLLGQTMRVVPIYARGSYQDIIKVDPKIDSTIPELLGLPRLPNNISEGLILRTNVNQYVGDGTRVMLKNKNAEFMEKVGQPKPKVAKQVPADPELQGYLDSLSVYLNGNRIDSALSKLPDCKDRNKLKNEILRDIMVDAAKDEWKEPEDPKLAKKLNVEFSKLIIEQLNNHLNTLK